MKKILSLSLVVAIIFAIMPELQERVEVQAASTEYMGKTLPFAVPDLPSLGSTHKPLAMPSISSLKELHKYFGDNFGYIANHIISNIEDQSAIEFVEYPQMLANGEFACDPYVNNMHLDYYDNMDYMLSYLGIKDGTSGYYIRVLFDYNHNTRVYSFWSGEVVTTSVHHHVEPDNNTRIAFTQKPMEEPQFDNAADIINYVESNLEIIVDHIMTYGAVDGNNFTYPQTIDGIYCHRYDVGDNNGVVLPNYAFYVFSQDYYFYFVYSKRINPYLSDIYGPNGVGDKFLLSGGSIYKKAEWNNANGDLNSIVDNLNSSFSNLNLGRIDYVYVTSDNEVIIHTANFMIQLFGFENGTANYFLGDRVSQIGTTNQITPQSMRNGSLNITSTTKQKVENIFVDIKATDWFVNSIQFVVDNGLFNGISATEFAPQAKMTRAMFMTVLARHKGIDLSNSNPWYAKAIQWGMQNGITDGTNPEGDITREQIVTLLWRLSNEPNISANLSFSDKEQVSDYAIIAVSWAVNKGIVNGYPENYFAPQGTASRAEVAAMTQRYVDATK